MEERAPPVAVAADLPVAAALPPRRAPSNRFQDAVLPQAVPPYHPRKITKEPSFSTSLQLKTYIVQIPKDQIFNVPPPEHAKIVEQYRNQKKSGKGGAGNGCCSPRCLGYTLGVLILIGSIIGISIAVKHALIKPKLPKIKIKSLGVKNNEFDVMVVVKDDGKMNISPDGKGDATLMYKSTQIGSGRVPGLRLGSGQSKSISLRLKASGKGKLPKTVRASMADKKGKSPISLGLTMRVPVVMSASGVKSQRKEIDVNCKLRVSSLGANKGVTSQKCQLNFV